jgi:hypothetical protein
MCVSGVAVITLDLRLHRAQRVAGWSHGRNVGGQSRQIKLGQ